MGLLKLSVINGGETKAAMAGSPVSLAYAGTYGEGDTIRFEPDTVPGFYMIQLDEAMLPALVFATQTPIDYAIPLGEKSSTISPKAFCGGTHLITARRAEDYVAARRNLALNPYDGYASPGLFPHAAANVETRDEASFAARNAIDGIYANDSHGKFPFGSWGINRRPDAELTLHFGAAVIIDELRLTLRADFPHDNYWTGARVCFSDGSDEVLSLVKTPTPQRFPISPRTVEWLRLRDLIKSEEESPFPALTQLEAWGVYAGTRD